MRFVEGQNFGHFPGSGETLAVFYAPARVQAGELPYYKRTAALPCGRLLINPGTDNFYQDCINEVEALVSEVSGRYKSTIHYGFSMGGYAAFRFGAADPKSRAVFAVSPTFVLSRKHSRSAYLMRVPPASERDDDARVFAAGSRASLFCYFSCLDALDGVHIEDSSALAATVGRYFYNESHQLPSINQPEKLIGEFLAGRSAVMRPDLFATARERDASIIAYNVRLSTFQRSVTAGDVEKYLDWRTDVRGACLFQWAGKVLQERGDHAKALPFFITALEKRLNEVSDRTMILESIGACLAAPGISASAEAIRALAR